jgi:glycopeptide antibiotics resistance protein
VRSFLDAVPLFPLFLAFGFVVCALIAPAVGQRLHARGIVAFLLLASLALVIAATLLPTADAMTGVSSGGTCDLTRIRFPTVSEVRGDSQTRLNLLLFLPLGISIALLPLGIRSVAIAVAAFALPWVIEGLQLTVQVLGRGCQSADVIDNLIGFTLGLATGLLLRLAIGPARLVRR